MNYLCLRIFLSLIYEGFCAQDDEPEGDDKEPDLEFDDGVGMGDGEGY